MKTFRFIPALFIALWFAGSVYAVPFDQGVYEFEGCGGDCTLSGTYVIQDNGEQEYLVSSGAGTDYVEFEAIGKHLLIYRYVAVGNPSMDICVNATCLTVSNTNTSADASYPYIATLTGGTDTIRITGNAVYLDKFMILDTPGAGSPFPTPTPDADPYVVYAVQPECRYETLDENIVSVCYTITGGDIGIIIFLAFIASALIGLILVIRWQQNG